MKKAFRFLFVAFLFVYAFVMGSTSVSAKSVSNAVFEVEVGTDKLPLYYTLEDDNGVIKEKIQFDVILKGLAETGKSYRWEHKFCHKVTGGEEFCEIDLTGKDQVGNEQDIVSDETYNFYFWDSDMPYYSDGLTFEYVRFSNKFICIEENCNEEIVLDDIEFLSGEIDYNYQFSVDPFSIENNGKKYVDNYFSQENNFVYVRGYLSNNLSSQLTWTDAPTFLITNTVCVGDNDCRDEAIETVKASSGEAIVLTPYIGNFTYYYGASNLLYDDNSNPIYDSARFKTVLQCQTKCNSRIPESIVLIDEVFYFDTERPVVDVDNTIISSVDEYVKSVEVKITGKDTKSGLDESNLFYQLTIPYYDCTWGQSYTFPYQNGVSFTLGPELSDGPYCMRYYVYDNTGNYYSSDYYVFYFDNNGPRISVNKDGYVETNYYNKVDLEVNFTDYYSGIDKFYYLWSKEEISEDDYLTIRSEGKEYDNNGILSSLNDIIEDDTYYLYFLAYDKLGNYKYYYSGMFNFDTVGLEASEVELEILNMDSYSADPSIKVVVDEMNALENFKCGFFKENNITVDDLSLTCSNNTSVTIPQGLEGEYSFWVYVHDRADNYSLLNVKSGLFIDTSGPIITYDILKNEDKYHITNSITLTATDENNLDGKIKYGWFAKGVTNVTYSSLVESIDNGESVGYPKGHYGEYKLYVGTKDNLGNEQFFAINKIFKVDTDIIRISLIGEATVTIIRGQKYKDNGAKAYKGDVSSGGRVSTVKTEGYVDTRKAGVYYVTYSSGEGELLVSVTRKVIDKSDAPYLIVSFSIFVAGTVTIGLRLFIKKKKD